MPLSRSLFVSRTAFKPFEYPEVTAFKDAITHSYWLVSEWNFQADKQDFHTRLTNKEQQVIKRALLVISQVEVAVKKFWGDIGKLVPKPEIMQIGATFAESEVRHCDAYSHLLEVLGLNQEFDRLLEVPCIQQRVKHLEECTSYKGADINTYLFRVATFSMLIENVSLFAQFLIVKAFNKHLSVLKDVDNVVQATQKEETVHALFGEWLLGQAREEKPSMFGETFRARMIKLAGTSYNVECAIIDWIFQDGDLDFLTASQVRAFVGNRINNSLMGIDIPANILVDSGELIPLLWFEEEIHADVHSDFFHKRPVTYAKKQQPINSGDLF